MTKQSHRQYYVYILTNEYNAVLYTGITNNLVKRTYEHKEKLVHSFSKRYNLNKLVYFEVFVDPENAILREKQIKGGSRQKKINLITAQNPAFDDLYDQIV
jgi:putative endonuclease